MACKKLKISFVSALTLDTDMHKTREIEILKVLAQRGHNTTLVGVTSRDHFELSDSRIHLVTLPIRYVPVISPFIWAFILVFFLPLHVLLRRPDYIVMDPEISVLSSVPTLLFSKLVGVKFVLDIRSTPVEVIGLRARLLAFLFNVSVFISRRLFSGIVIVTSLMKTEVCQKFRLDPRKVGVWTNGVSLELFLPSFVHEQSVELGKRLGLTGKFIVFYHGAFSPTRGLTETLEAVRIVKQRYSDVVLLLLGDGPTLIQLKGLIEQGGLGDNVVIHAPIAFEEVPKFIALCDVGLVPLPNNSYWRFQNALNLLEYMAMEKVVLATDIEANRVVVGTDVCCVYIPLVSPSEIAKSIEYVYVHRDKLCVWGKSGRRIIQSSYTWEKVGDAVEQYLCSI
ncbi:MAG: glycosyltransferase family 4 protein [Nitrososphaerota archaeon]|nr:glycosyltransferase family 4 protein [Nitrososphaerota archaeon]